MANRRTESSNYRNPCLTMHQPWASLLVYGIKRIEGRSWPAPIRGRLWIHAAGKVPEPDTIKDMEDFYREIYALNGITDIKFPKHYPISRLLGCVEMVGCITCEELVNWEAMPESVRLEGQTALCWLCEQPQRLIVPFEMRGFQGVYNLERKIYEAAVRGISSIKPPQPVTFPLPNPRDRFSLAPGSLSYLPSSSGVSENEQPPSLVAAVARARAAATQFSKNPSPQPPKAGVSPPNPISKSEKQPSPQQLSKNHSPEPPNMAASPPNRVSEGENRPTLVRHREDATQLSQNHRPQPSVEGSKRPVLTRTSKEWVQVRRLLGGAAESSLATKGV